jgi:hypothetical protein
MTEHHQLLAAASALLGEAERDHKEFLGSVVNTARALFGAAAATVFLLDEQPGELVFEAVSGEGESYMVGRRFPASRGIAGWVLSAHEPLDWSPTCRPIRSSPGTWRKPPATCPDP